MPSTSGIHILSELFVVLGYFALNNSDNQVRVIFMHLNLPNETIRSATSADSTFVPSEMS